MSTVSYDRLMSFDGAFLEGVMGSTVTIPRTIPESKLNDYILGYLSGLGATCPIKHSFKTRAVKFILCTGGILGRIPLVPVSLAFRDKSEAVAYVATGFNFLAFSAYAIWSTIRMVDNTALSLSTTEEKQSISYDRCRKISALVFNLFNGLIAQIPSLFLSWNYNQAKPLMLGFNVLDIVPPVYSLNIMVSEKLANLAFSQDQKKIINIKRDLIRQIDNKMKTIAKDPCPSLIETMLHLQVMNSSEIKTNRFLEIIMSEYIPDAAPLNPCIHDLKESIANTIGFMLLGIQMFFSAFLTYKGVSLITDNIPLTGIICLYVVVCHIALTRFVLVKSTYLMVNALFCTNRHNKNYHYICDRLAPKSSFILKALCLIISSAAFIQAAKISSDFLPEAFVFPSTLTYGLGLAIMNYLPLRDLTHNLSAHLILKCGTQDQVIPLLIYNQLTHIKRIFENASTDSLAFFLLKNQYSSMLHHLMQKHEVRADALVSFLQTRHTREVPALYEDLYNLGDLA